MVQMPCRLGGVLCLISHAGIESRTLASLSADLAIAHWPCFTGMEPNHSGNADWLAVHYGLPSATGQMVDRA